jgi:hypothetical protein
MTATKDTTESSRFHIASTACLSSRVHAGPACNVIARHRRGAVQCGP